MRDSRPVGRVDYDLVVLGGGAAGLVAAVLGASLGARTAIVERARLGGDCTWRGCVPSKALLHVAAVAHDARTARRFGVDVGDVSVSWDRVHAWLDDVRDRIYEQADAPAPLGRYGVRVYAGNATFLDATRLRVTGADVDEVVTSSRFVICTGSDPTPLDLGIPYLTTDTIFDMNALPRRTIVIGGGPVSVELAQAFARLGSDVQVLAREARLLVRDDPEHAHLLQRVLEREGVRLTLGADVVGARIEHGEKIVVLRSGEELRADEVLVAVGRTPRVSGFGLDAAGVEVANGAIVVDARCRTTARHVYASGDVTGPPYFTHAAEEMSKVAVSNALLRLRRRYDRTRMPWCTYTSPELAHAGLSETTLRERGTRYRTLCFPNDELDRAIVDDRLVGSTKLFVDQRGRLLGASVLGPRAGEVIGELALAIGRAMPVSRIADTVHCYPSYSYGARRAADRWYLEMLTPLVRRVLRVVFGFRGSAS